VLLQIFLRALELPIRHAEDDSETDQDHKFKPGKFALHSMSILFDWSRFRLALWSAEVFIQQVTDFAHLQNGRPSAARLHPTLQEEQ